MSCVFAFLLAATGRMLITGSIAHENYYGLFNYNPSYHFPEPNPNVEVYLFTHKIISSGTNYAMYCSPRKTMSEIVENIVGLSPAKISHKPETIPHRTVMQACLRKIESLSGTPLLSKLIHNGKRDNPCTSSTIFDLILSRELKMIGRYNCFPSSSGQEILHTVTADIPMALKNALPLDSTLMTAPIDKIDEALTWHHGRLILLSGSEVGKKVTWKPKNFMENELRSGELIVKFMNENFPGAEKIQKHIINMSKLLIYMDELKVSDAENPPNDGDIPLSKMFEANHFGFFVKFVQNSQGSLEEKLMEVTPKGYLCD